MHPFRHRFWLHRCVWTAAGLLVLWWTLLPFRQDLSADALVRALADVQWVPFVERGRAPLWSDVLGNLALFVPFGFAGWRCLDGRRARLILLLAAALTLSFAVEVIQLTLPARRSSTTDLATDAAGALIGAGLGRLWEVRGRDATRAWVADLARGETAHLLAVLFAACLLAWAVLPGPASDSGVWNQVQGFSSSFRRFPGLEAWTGGSVHLFLLGWLFATLATRSGRGGGLGRAVFGVLAAGFVGLGIETVQLLSPSRRPEIFQALAFAAGGVPGAVVGLCPRPVVVVVSLIALGFGLAFVPTGDSPAGVTWAALGVGAVMTSWSEWVRPRTQISEPV